MMKMYYEADADPGLITRRKVAVIGFGSQGHFGTLFKKRFGTPPGKYRELSRGL